MTEPNCPPTTPSSPPQATCFTRFKAWSHVPLLLAVLSGQAHAVGTERFVLDSEQDLSDGKLEGAAVESSGRVIAGVSTERVAIPDAATARALLVTAGGQTFVGVGTSGTVYRAQRDSLTPFAETGALLVTALVEGPQQALFAATSPKGQIFKIDASGKVEPWVTLANTQHVWSLAYDTQQQLLYAGTGPEGTIYRIGPDKKPELYLDTDADHVMSLALDSRGRLYAGTTGEALLLEVTGKQQMQVVYDFEGNEITAIALGPRGLAVCENTFPKPGKKKQQSKPSPEKSAVSNDNPSGTAGKSTPAGKATPSGKPGKGQLWLIEGDGRARHLFESPSGHFTSVAFDGEAILVGLGSEGQIYRVQNDGTHALWADVDERQIGAIAVRDQQLRFVTGDGAAYYHQIPPTKHPARWLSKPQDAHFHARFGQLSFRARGRVELSTRSGNSEKPDESWSPWSTALSQPGPIRSPAGRFLQIRAMLAQDAQLFAVTAHYLPQNQPPSVGAVRAAPGSHKGGVGEHTSLYTIHWDSDARDGDTLRYRLYYRPEDETQPRPLLREHIRYTKRKFDWNTDSVPDGFYVIEVVASDEPDNPALQAEEDRALSEPILVDNHPPHFSPLRVRRGEVRGEVRDRLGPVTLLQYKIDNEPWRPLRPVDDMLDTAKERFAFRLPADLQPGVHVVAVRASDARNNLASAELEVNVVP